MPQVIDDTRSITLAAASTLTPDVKAAVEGNGGTVVRGPAGVRGVCLCSVEAAIGDHFLTSSIPGIRLWSFWTGARMCMQVPLVSWL
jgi:hypothetical protein